MSFTSTDTQKAETTTWLTPKLFFEELGPFDFDPCAAPKPRPFDSALNMNSREDGDGLAMEWKGRVWLNPPYGKEAAEWMQKLSDHGSGMALLFNRIDSKWLRPFIKKHGCFFLSKRISFLSSDGKSRGNAGTGSILIPVSQYDTGRILCSKLDGVWLQ